MTSFLVRVIGEAGWKSGVCLDHEGPQCSHPGYIFWLNDGSDYHYCVKSTFFGTDTWGVTHWMADVEPFLKRDTKAYMAANNIDPNSRNANGYE